MTLGLLPLVESATRMSFPAAVNTEGFVVSARAASPARSVRSRTTSSAARCSASAALPPFPKKTILPPARRAAADFSANCAILPISSSEKLCLTRALSASWRRISSAGEVIAALTEHDFFAVAHHAARGVARIDHQLCAIGNRRKVIARMVGSDNHGIVTSQRLRIQGHRFHALVIEVPHLVQFWEIRIVIVQNRAALLQKLHDFQRRRFPQIVHVLL